MSTETRTFRIGPGGLIGVPHEDRNADRAHYPRQREFPPSDLEVLGYSEDGVAQLVVWDSERDYWCCTEVAMWPDIVQWHYLPGFRRA